MNNINVNKDSRNIAVMMWIGTIFLGFVPGLIFYLTKKEDEFVQLHAKEALNWSITMIVGYIIGFILTFLLIGIFVILTIGLMHFIFCIMGAVKASNGIDYRAAFNIRLIK